MKKLEKAASGRTHPIWRSTIDWVPLKKDMETPRGTSMTVPDMNTSLRTIIEQFTRGIQPQGRTAILGHENASFDDIDMEAFQRMELQEKVFYLEERNRAIENYRLEQEAERNQEKIPPKDQNPQPTEANQKSGIQQKNEEK